MAIGVKLRPMPSVVSTLGTKMFGKYEPCTGTADSHASPIVVTAPPAISSGRGPIRQTSRDDTCAPMMIATVCGKKTKPAPSGE